MAPVQRLTARAPKVVSAASLRGMSKASSAVRRRGASALCRVAPLAAGASRRAASSVASAGAHVRSVVGQQFRAGQLSNNYAGSGFGKTSFCGKGQGAAGCITRGRRSLFAARAAAGSSPFTGGAGRGRRTRGFNIVGFLVQVVVLYLLFKGGAVYHILKWFLYLMLLLPLLFPTLQFLLRLMLEAGKCPNCGIQFKTFKGKSKFNCPACRAPIEKDLVFKQFVRAAPSWEGQAGPGSEATADATGETRTGASQQSQTSAETNSAADEIIDVEVIDITPNDKK